MGTAHAEPRDWGRRMTTVYTNLGGGLGDSLFVYFNYPQFRYIEPLKQKMPEVKIIHVNTCHMDWAYELVYMHPHIDGWFNYRWYPPSHPMAHQWQQMISAEAIESFCKHHKIHAGPEPKLYLSDIEETIVQQIADSGPFIAVQAFGGLPYKSCKPDPSVGRYLCFPDYKYLETMEILRSEYHYNIVVIGRSTFADYGTRRQDCTLDIPKNPGYFDLTDKYSIRVSTALVMRSAAFFGVASSMMTAARVTHRPMVLFLPIIPEIVNLNPVRTFGGPACKFSIEEPWCTLYELLPDGYINDLTSEAVASQLCNNIHLQQKMAYHG